MTIVWLAVGIGVIISHCFLVFRAKQRAWLLLSSAMLVVISCLLVITVYGAYDSYQRTHIREIALNVTALCEKGDCATLRTCMDDAKARLDQRIDTFNVTLILAHELRRAAADAPSAAATGPNN
jgi:hypothetical protein